MSRPDERVAPREAASLVGALDYIAVGIALFDVDGALVACNRAYRDLNVSIEDLIAPGVSYETLVRAGVAPGEGRPPSLSLDAEIGERLATYRRADGLPTVRPRGNSWLMSTIRRTPNGGT